MLGYGKICTLQVNNILQYLSTKYTKLGPLTFKKLTYKPFNGKFPVPQHVQLNISRYNITSNLIVLKHKISFTAISIVN